VAARDTRWHFQVYKRSVVDDQHRFIERAAIRMDGASYVPDKPKDPGAKFCTDMRDVSRKLDEIVPGFEKTFEEVGGYWMLDECRWG
jgi:alpha 1,2-mannosyltransferase